MDNCLFRGLDSDGVKCLGGTNWREAGNWPRPKADGGLACRTCLSGSQPNVDQYRLRRRP
jgi:hypothetical protein